MFERFTKFSSKLDKEDLKELELAIRIFVAETLENKINVIVERKLDEWFKEKIEHRVDKEIKNEFSKMMIIKFGGSNNPSEH